MVGVKGLKPSTSRSQTERAINCATPRQTIVCRITEQAKLYQRNTSVHKT
jgi:hypothetical protein